MTQQLDGPFLAALIDRARQALVGWDIPLQDPALLKYRENAVFRIRLADGRFAALRLHRPGYHGIAALRSELEWMMALHRDGIDVPQALPDRRGEAIVELPANDSFPLQHADVVSWVEGVPLGETGQPLPWSSNERTRLFLEIGAGMAAMHESADRFQPRRDFFRPAWDADGLIGESPLWGRFWDCDFLSSAQKDMLSSLRQRLSDELARPEIRGLDYGLIHADLIWENIFVNSGQVSFIDFDDCGYGFRMFDIATTLLKNHREPDFSELSEALITGYRQRRDLSEKELAALPLFLTLRSLTYIGWLAARPELPDVSARLERYVDVSSKFARAGGFLA